MKFETIYFTTKIIASLFIFIFIGCMLFDWLLEIRYVFLIVGTFLHLFATVIARAYKKGL